MNVRVLSGPDAVARETATLVARTVGRRADAVLALPTGRTAVPFYDELARRHKEEGLDLSRVRAFNLDELVLPPEHPASFAAFMRRHAWERIGLDRRHCDIPHGDAIDRRAECRRYDRALAAAGRLDLAVVGVGADGHVAYNLPGQTASATHVVELPDELADRIGVPTEERPLHALTMGLEPLLGAKAVAVMAFGSTKAAAIARLVDGPPDPSWPCSLLHGHPAIEVFIDVTAAKDCRTLEAAASPSMRE